jgi:hypothetical protein
MKSCIARLVIILGLGFFLGGCASFSSTLDHGRSVKSVQRFFVLSNPSDNHALDHQLAEALKARGREAEIGPLTMMPDNTQAVISYQDHWAWDFGDHLMFLQFVVRDKRAEQAFATVTFSAKIPLHEEASETLGRLVDKLLEK